MVSEPFASTDSTSAIGDSAPGAPAGGDPVTAPATVTAPWPDHALPPSGYPSEDPLTRSEMARAFTVLRVTRNWSQGDLARAAGMHKSAISEYERGKKMPEMVSLSR